MEKDISILTPTTKEGALALFKTLGRRSLPMPSDPDSTNALFAIISNGEGLWNGYDARHTSGLQGLDTPYHGIRLISYGKNVGEVRDTGTVLVFGDSDSEKDSHAGSIYDFIEYCKFASTQVQIAKFHERLDQLGTQDFEARKPLDEAIAYILDKHGDQRRKEGGPYCAHLVRTALILLDATQGHDMPLVVAGLLHDVIEDTELGIPMSEKVTDLTHRFGKDSANLVWAVSRYDENGNRLTREVQHQIEMALPDGPQKNRALLLRLADAIDNMESSRFLSDSFDDKRYEWYGEHHLFGLEIANLLQNTDLTNQLQTLLESEAKYLKAKGYSI